MQGVFEFMTRRRALTLLFIFNLLFLLSACRTRIIGSGQNISVSDAVSAPADVPGSESSDDMSPDDVPLETASVLPDDAVAPDSTTQENPDSSRKEYDENASVEVIPGTDRALAVPGEGTSATLNDMEAEIRSIRISDASSDTATQTVAASDSEKAGVSADADSADSILTYYTVLLRDRVDSLFECQRLSVYWETVEEHVTIHKSSAEHALILGAGTYDVSSRLLPENLRVDDGWVVRKDPGMIIRIVDNSILGADVHSASSARSVLRELLSRNGWATIDAVRNERVLLLSSHLLETPSLRTAASLLIAKIAYPALFEDVDPGDALQALAEEETGIVPTGLFYFTGKEDQ